ncbi:MAG: T9SS type A sorting domain-containing protein [Saprospiraceae bacterium]
MRQFCLSMMLCFSLFTNAIAQETWTGSVDGDWTNNANWLDNTAPISGTINGVLTIQTGAANEPTSNLPTSISAVQLVVMSPFTIPSTTTVDIDNTTGTGDGVITSMSGANLTVIGILNVNNAHDNGLAIGQDGTQLLNLGTISVNGSNAAGILLTGSGSSVNQGNFTINHSGTNGILQLANAAPFNSFDNQNCLVVNNSGSDAIDNRTFFENSNKITIETAGGHGVNNTGLFTNDSLASLTINKVTGNGITTDSIFNNDAGFITIGNGNFGDIGSHGIEVIGGTFINNSTVSQGGGMVTINGVAGDGINITGALENGGVAVGDSLGMIIIDNVNGNGVSISMGSTFRNQENSKLLIGENEGGIQLFGVFSAGTLLNDNAITMATGMSGSLNFTASGMLVNSGNMGIIQIDKATTFPDGYINSSIIKSSAPANSVTLLGTFTNNGIIVDPNNSFGISDRVNTPGITNTGGVIIIPDTMMCYTDTIAPFLITGSTQPETLPYLPSPTFAMGGNPNAATFDATNNRLVLNEVQSLMNFSFDILLNGTNTNQTCTTSLTFENLPNTFLACVGNLQVTLIDDCQATLKPSDLLQGNLSCNDGYKIGIVGQTMGDSLILNPTHIGNTVNVMVTNPLGNSCWTSLLIEDKTTPICEDTRDTIFFCGQDFKPSSINVYPIVTDACSAIVDTIVRDKFISNFTNCGSNIDDPDTLNHIQRTWVFTDAAGNSTSCVQNLYELKPTLKTVQFPDNLVGANALNCGMSLTEANVGAPFVVVGNNDTILVKNICRFGVNFEETTININSSDKQRISRTWFVTDWCNSNDGNRIAIGQQLIEIVDHQAPTIDSIKASDVVINGTANHDCAVDIIVPPVTNLADNCAAVSELTVIITGPSNTIFGNGGTMPNVPFGTHDIVYIITDPSGNRMNDTISITVDDVLPPVAIAQEISVTLIDSIIVTWVYATSFDGGSHDNCGIDSILARKSNVDTFSTAIAFSCSDIGMDTIMLKVVDTAGNVSFSWSEVIIENKLNICPAGKAEELPISLTGEGDGEEEKETTNSFARVAGHIQNEKGDMVESVNISIGGYEMAPTTTGTTGTFSFEEIPLNGSYRITPEKDMNYANGLTTFDIVLLSKHVLGIKPLDSPYKMIAADVNHSGSISAYDMVLLRQVILGMKEDFPDNTSWRFIDADYEFLNPVNPFVEIYPEAYEITNLVEDMMTLDFVAVKIGDLNNSAAANQFITAESRNTTTALNFEIAEQVKKAGETVTVDFKASNFEEILGYQFEVDFDGNALAFEQLLIGDKMSFDNFNLSMLQRGMITTSWNEAEAIKLDADEVLFSLVFKAKENLRLSEVIQLGSNITPAEAYTGTEEIISVNLNIAEPVTINAGITLYQNKPNPFTGETLIGFDLPVASTATMTILDMSGKVVKVIKGEYGKGYNQIIIEGKAFTEHGMFYYQLATQNGVETKKMILLKQ